jgi:hypothetical protein
MAKSCLMAPVLKKWSWLDNDSEAQVENWRMRARELVSNLVLIDGALHARHFEPCYALDVDGKVGRIRTLGTGVYQEEPHRLRHQEVLYPLRSERVEERLPILGPRGFDGNLHLFSAVEWDSACAFRETLGLRPAGAADPEIVVHDQSAISGDFIERETVRFARIALERALLTPHLEARAIRENPSRLPNPGISVLEVASEAMHRIIAEWYKGECRIDDVAYGLRELGSAFLDWNTEGYVPEHRITIDDAVNGLRDFAQRQDGGPINIQVLGV